MQRNSGAYRKQTRESVPKFIIHRKAFLVKTRKENFYG